jgi:hypothetical protein
MVSQPWPTPGCAGPSQMGRAVFSAVWPVRSSWDVLRVLSAVVVLVAAVLKAYQLSIEPAMGPSLLEARWLLMSVVEFELFFAIWLLGGNLPRLTWATTLALFAVFTCVSLYEALAGYASCGCFGRAQLNPWYTSSLDLVVVLSLLRWPPKRPGSPPAFTFRLLFLRGATVLIIWVLVGIPAALAMNSYADTTISDAGELTGNGKTVVLKPETWVGKRFPLLEHIDVGHKLTDGLWLVLLHRHDCSACREAASEYEALAKDFSTKLGCPAIALIECPPFAPTQLPGEARSWISGRLSDAHEWHLSGPTSVLLDGGQVRNVFINARDVELLKAIWGNNRS